MQTIGLSASALTIFPASNGPFGAFAAGYVPLVDSRFGQVNGPGPATWCVLGKQVLAESGRAAIRPGPADPMRREGFGSRPHLNDLCGFIAKAIGAPGREAWQDATDHAHSPGSDPRLKPGDAEWGLVWLRFIVTL